MSIESDEPIQVIIQIFNEAFSSFDLPACIGIVDSDGFALVTSGNCPDITLFEGQLASLIDTFETIRERFKRFEDDLNLMMLEFGKNTYYLDNLLQTNVGSANETILYLVAQSDQKDLLQKARPFLVSIVNKIEQMFHLSNEEE
jgi:hypothetical protein